MGSHPHLIVTLFLTAGLALLTACSTAPTTPQAREGLSLQSESAIARFHRADPGLRSLTETAYGYAVFPEVTKGGAGLGGAHGRGAVYEHGEFAGFASLAQGTLGAQLGGQQYSELILFEDQAALERFKEGRLAFAAQASAVAAKAGASADADYEKGVMVFTLGTGGLMAEASVGGQKFSFEPARTAGAPAR